MDKSNWRTFSNLALVVGVLAAGYALFPWLQCTFAGAQDDAPAAAADEDQGSALDLAEEARHRRVPSTSTGFWGRLSDSSAQCRQLHPLGDDQLAWGVSVGALLLMVAGRLFASRAGSAVAARDEGLSGGNAGPGGPGGYTGDRRSSDRAMATGSRAGQAHRGGGRAGQAHRGGGRDGVPEAITISQELDLEVIQEELNADDDGADALVNYIEDDDKAREEAFAERVASRRSQPGEVPNVDGFYCPPGLEEAPAIYVDPEHGAASDAMDDPEARADNPERPFVTIQAALDRAHKLFLKQRSPVQVRVMPGVYQESVYVGPHVSLVNHRLPAEGSIRQHLQWLIAQDEVGHPDRVTILPPADAEFAVKFETGQRQGIFGCHLVGREGVDQRGIIAEHCQSLAVVHCAVEDFSAGGLAMVDCGGNLPKTAVQVVGCRLRNNRAARGGAVFFKGGTLRVEKTRLEKNRAQMGGAIFAIDLSGAMVLDQVGFRKNLADSPDRLTVRPDVVALQDWLKGTGQGGGIAAVRSKLKLVDCKFVVNQAKVSGGAIALLGAQAVVESRGSGTSFKKNKSRVGGAVFMAGWMGCRCTLKADGARFEHNHAGSDGGAVAVVGLSVAQLVEARFEHNEAAFDHGVGGAAASLKGGQFMAKETKFRNNRTAGRGGAVGAINASIVLSDGCIVEENVADGGDGGGLFCLSESNPDMEELMNRTDFKLPLVFTTRDVAIRRNRAAGKTGGMWVGNVEKTATFPVKVTLEKPMYARNNEAAQGNELSADYVVRWKGRVEVNSTERGRQELLLN